MTTQDTILIIDDDSSIRWVLAKALQNAGFKVVACDEGKRALDIIADQPPALVISDIQMPGLSGLQLLETLQASHPWLPVIIITANADTDIGSQTHSLGAYDYLPKPFDLNHVIQVCKNALDKQELEEKLPLWQQQLNKVIEQEYANDNIDILLQLQQEFEQLLIKNALTLSNGHKQKAAKLLNWGRNTLTRKLKH